MGNHLMECSSLLLQKRVKSKIGVDMDNIPQVSGPAGVNTLFAVEGSICPPPHRAARNQTQEATAWIFGKS